MNIDRLKMQGALFNLKDALTARLEEVSKSCTWLANSVKANCDKRTYVQTMSNIEAELANISILEQHYYELESEFRKAFSKEE